ncbi:MAG TPA: helix-turn-helix domain-containing protein [Conexibacter sp.]|nr:helix-turn-helix domain-containing protein [Conexibacter sp.]
MPRGEDGDKPRRQWAPDARALSVIGDRWVMVIVRDLASGPLRLEALRRWLPGVSAGALESRLSRMVEAGLITRRRRRSLPPRVDLELTEQGHALGDAIGELARWELRTQWSRPREDEWVDVGACFRLAPLLQRVNAADDGQLALTIADASNGGPEHYTFVREHGRARIERRDTPSPDARMSGTEAAWVKALSPESTPASLDITGNPDLAAEFLDLFKV